MAEASCHILASLGIPRPSGSEYRSAQNERKHEMFLKPALRVLLLLNLGNHAIQAQQISIYASGLEGPRGLKFGPDGALYVAEAGHGGTNSTQGLCAQVVAPVGPYHGGPSARISKITGAGQRSTVVSGLPSAISSLPSGDTMGVADVAFLGNNLFAVLAGGGCSHGNASAPNGIIRVDARRGTWEYVNDLSAFFRSNPVALTEPGDFEPDGTPFTMIVSNGHFNVVEANHGQIARVNAGGHTERLLDFSATQGHIVPTAIASFGGDLFVGTLSRFPIQPGSARVYRLSEKGDLLGFMPGFTTVTGIAFDHKGRLYVLELSAAAGFPTPGAGKIVRVNQAGQIEDFVNGLVVPTGLTVGPDGALYVSNFGAAPPGLGQVLRITIPD
jgi:hypothetical protein